MKQFLGLEVGLTTTSEASHEREMNHKNVKPTNILAHSSTDQAGLMDSGSLPASGASTRPPNLQGSSQAQCLTWPPERTGRKNRSIDSRSDMYALDGTLYEMLNGNLPFTASDPVEWVDCHIAKHPVPPHDRAKSVPACVYDIVMKLDAKTPEERDHTAFGVDSDLRRRVAGWEPHKFLADASPAHDNADCVLSLERLYGRAPDLAIRLTAFGRVLAGVREFILRSGNSGIGQSAIFNESPKAADH